MRRVLLWTVCVWAVLVRAEEEERSTNTTLGEVGTKFTILDSPIDDMFWCQENKDIVLALTEKQSLYRSVDKGYTWLKLSNQLQKQGYLELDEGQAEMEVGGVKSIIVSKADPKYMIFQGTGNINWKTTDCGKTLTAMNQGRSVQEFQFHPQEKDWLLAAAWSRCDDYEDEPCKVVKELFYSTDFGEDWTQIEDYVVQFAWAQLQNHFMVPKERIIVALDPNGEGHQKLKGWSNDVHLVQTDDFFNTSRVILEKGNKFVLTNKYLYGVQVADQQKAEIKLFVSYSHESHYHFRESTFPFQSLKDYSYSILDDSESQTFLQINHHGPASKMGTIYTSNSRGDVYAQSLAHSVRLSDGVCDFEKVQSLNGVFISNVYDPKRVQQQKSADYSPKTSRKGRDTSSTVDLESAKQTVISFNKGGIWQSLSAPEVDCYGQKIKCDDSTACTLHLHSSSNSQYGPFYSQKNAVGIVMGTGNVGAHLSLRAAEINTFMSRDGGLTWFEVAKGSHIYEVGDHGSLLLLVDDQKPTNQAIFSWDEGLTQYNVQFAPMQVQAQNIVIEPESVATTFMIYGTVQGKGFVSVLDFASLHTRNCVMSDNLDDEKSDYEVWTPKDQRFSNCFQGRKIQYTRRKRERDCFNGMEYEPKQLSSVCQCTEEDWECDVGFAREGSGPCKPNGKNITNNDEKKCVFGQIVVTQGYRKISGDLCIGGVDHAPIYMSCGSDFSINYQYIFILLVVAAVLYFFGNSTVPDLVKEQLEKNKQLIKEKLAKYKKAPAPESDYRQFAFNDEEQQGMQDNNQNMFDD